MQSQRQRYPTIVQAHKAQDNNDDTDSLFHVVRRSVPVSQPLVLHIEKWE